MFNNLGVKIGALSVAFLLWLHVVTEKTYTYTFQVSLRPVHLAEDLIIANALPKHMHVKIRGKGKRLFWLVFSDIKIILNLQDTIQSKSRFRLDVSDVVIPRDLDVTILEVIEPDYVDVDIDRFVQKSVPVGPKLRAIPANGFVTVGSTGVFPDSATISGPRRFVEPIDTLYTESVTVRRAKRRVSRELLLLVPEETNISVTPSTVSAEVDVQKLQKRVMTDIPVHLLHAPSHKKVSLDSFTITLTLEGGEEVLETLTHEDLRVTVDYRQTLQGSTGVMTPTVFTPAGVTWIEAQPQTFSIVD